MPFRMDHEIAAAFTGSPAPGDATAPVKPRPRDAIGLRDILTPRMQVVDAAEPDSPHVQTVDHAIPVAGGEILARWYVKQGSSPGSAVVYFHGGGRIVGSVDLNDRLVAKYVEITGVPFLSVDYRLAPEQPGMTAVQDGFAGLSWLVQRAADFGFDVARLAVLGDSGGGGVAAGVAIAARDAGVAIAKQILIYPMLDDRTVDPDPAIEPFATWTYEDNLTVWEAVLGVSRGSDAVSPMVAPSRLTNFVGLAPAFIDVGELDIYRDESVDYARRLLYAGVSTELHVRSGCPHGFDRTAAAVSAASWEDRYRAVLAL